MKQFRALDPNLPDRVRRDRCALAVMTKAPKAGRVKTRLVPPLTPEEAAELNRCFLRDTTATISNVCRHRSVNDGRKTARASAVAAYTPVGAESAYKDILPSDFSLLPQRGNDF